MWILPKGTALLKPHDHTDREKDKTTCHVTLSYIRRLSKELHRIFKDLGCSTNFKPGKPLWQLLVFSKDSAKKEEIGGAVYS